MVLDWGFQVFECVALRCADGLGVGFKVGGRNYWGDLAEGTLGISKSCHPEFKRKRRERGRLWRLFYNGVPQFAPLYESYLLPGANVSIRFRSYRLSDRILNELAPMGCCMVVSLEEHAFGSGPGWSPLQRDKGLGMQSILWGEAFINRGCDSKKIWHLRYSRIWDFLEARPYFSTEQLSSCGFPASTVIWNLVALSRPH